MDVQEIVRTMRGAWEASQREIGGTGPDGVTVRAVMRQADSLAVALESLTIASPTATELGEAGRGLAGKLTYLLEPVVLLEVGADRALLRSMPPLEDGHAVCYYEIWLRTEQESTTAEIQRYRARRGEYGRERLAVNVTWEVMERLLTDVYDILRP